MRLISVIASLALAGLAQATASDFATDADSAVSIEEWKVPFEASRPRDPFAVTGDTVWFVGQRTGYLARLDVANGAFEKVDLPEGEGPHNLIVGSDGVVWYAGNRTGVIGRYDPRTGEIEEIAMPDEAARDPHTLVFDADESHIWFTVQGGNFIGRLAIDSREVDLIASRTERSRPYGIKLGPDGTIWVALFGTHKLAKVNAETLVFEEINLPREGARPRRLEVGEDGRVWYVDYAEGFLGVYDPQTDAIEEWPAPSGAGSRPYGTAMDDQGRVWFVETGPQPNLFAGFDPSTEEFFASAPVPSGGGTIRHMHFHGPSGAIWFGADANTIGRAIVSSPAAADGR